MFVAFLYFGTGVKYFGKRMGQRKTTGVFACEGRVLDRLLVWDGFRILAFRNVLDSQEVDLTHTFKSILRYLDRYLVIFWFCPTDEDFASQL